MVVAFLRRAVPAMGLVGTSIFTNGLYWQLEPGCSYFKGYMIELRASHVNKTTFLWDSSAKDTEKWSSLMPDQDSGGWNKPPSFIVGLHMY